MSTNFYHRYNLCECCGRFDERHVGKWTSLQGYRRPDWYDDDQPFDEVLSWADWKARLRAGGELWDEYGKQWEVEKFIASMEGVPSEGRRRQYDWIREHGYPRGYLGKDDDWLDPDGFSFCGRDFT